MTTNEPSRIPLWLKASYTVFMAVQVPVYLCHYGPTVFLYICDVALVLTMIAVWTESPLLSSAALVGIFVPQMLWVNDFLFALVGAPLSPLTAYMFDEQRPLYLRLLSSFHFWLPFLLIWLVWLIGFDKRGVVLWTALIWVLLPICFLFMPPPGNYVNPNLLVNINFVYGFSLTEEQALVERHVYLALLMLAWPAVIFLPTHLLFWWAMPARPRTPGRVDLVLQA
jgi:hypothetical protein